jgi:3-deoxy-7-phosphoheptulonate synthase
MSRVLTTFGLTAERTIVSIPDAAPSRDRSTAGGVDAPTAIDIGGERLVVIAGPCAVEGRDMILGIAQSVRQSGASMLRGGAYKPRTSPYAFQGLGIDALEFLTEARAATGLPIVTEVLDPRDVEHVARHADLMQIGARNMQNYPLLAEVGRTGRPVVLKRGFSATLEELLMAAEHIMAHGNAHIVLCERGIRTFEPSTRNTLDISAIPLLKAATHLPVIVDPSHAGGRADLVAPLSLAAIAAGADGLMIEVHPDPACAQSDGEQSLDPMAFAELMTHIAVFAEAAGRLPPGALAERSRGARDERGRSDAHPGHSGSHADPSGARRGQSPKALATLRSGIERIDQKIMGLIGQRVELARDAGRVKREAGLPVIDEIQEHEVLARVRDLATSAGIPYEELHALQAYLIEISRRAQTRDPHPSRTER